MRNADNPDFERDIYQPTAAVYYKRLDTWQEKSHNGDDIVLDVLRCICSDDGNLIDPFLREDGSDFYTYAQQVRLVSILVDVWRFEKDVPGLPENIAFTLGRAVDEAEKMAMDKIWYIPDLHVIWSRARDLASEAVNPHRAVYDEP